MSEIKSCPLCGDPCDITEAAGMKIYGCQCVGRDPLFLPAGWVKEVCVEGRMILGAEDIERKREEIRLRTAFWPFLPVALPGGEE